MRRCPTCEEEIDEHLEVCPWCGRKTGFKPGGPLYWLKSLFHRPLIYYVFGVIALVSVAIGLSLGCKNRPSILGSGNKLGVNEVIDSFIEVMPQGSQVVARFNDERHSLYYLNTGHLMKFNAVSKMLDEINLNELDEEAHIYYNDRDDITGILEAKISEDEKFIIIRAVNQRNDKNSDEYKTISYKLNTESMNLLPYNYVPPKQTKLATDSTRRYKKRSDSRPTSITDISENNAEQSGAAKSQPVETVLEEQPVAAPAPAPTPAPTPPPAPTE